MPPTHGFSAAQPDPDQLMSSQNTETHQGPGVYGGWETHRGSSAECSAPDCGPKGTRITRDDVDSVIIHLPEFRYLDTQAWSMDVGVSVDALRELRDVIDTYLSTTADGSAPEPDPVLTRYRVMARRTDDTHPGATTITHYTYAQSAEEAVAKVREAHEKPGGVYGDQGLYQVVEVTEVHDAEPAAVPQSEPSAARVLRAEHTPAGYNEYGSCITPGYRADERGNGLVRVEHRMPAPDLTNPDRPSSDELAAERNRQVDAYAATLTAAGWAVVRQRTFHRYPWLLARPAAQEA